MLSLEWMYTPVLYIQVMLLDDHIGQDLPVRVDYRSARVVG